MTDKQRLNTFKRAIRKAEKNGFDSSRHFPSDQHNVDRMVYIREEIMLGIIFSHSFAQSFWGSVRNNRVGKHFGMSAWEHHLADMVLEEEPLQYLKKFI